MHVILDFFYVFGGKTLDSIKAILHVYSDIQEKKLIKVVQLKY